MAVLIEKVPGGGGSLRLGAAPGRTPGFPPQDEFLHRLHHCTACRMACPDWALGSHSPSGGTGALLSQPSEERGFGVHCCVR